jgi:hypothetical protein
LQDFHVGQLVHHAAILVLSQQGLRHRPGLGSVAAEPILFLHPGGPLAAAQGRLVVGDVADQIEGIELQAQLLLQRLQQQALLGQLLDDRRLALLPPPAAQEGIEAGVLLAHRAAAVIAQRFSNKFAVFIEVFDPLGEDAHRLALDVVLAAWLSGGVGGQWVRKLRILAIAQQRRFAHAVLLRPEVVVFRLGGVCFLRRQWWILLTRLINLHRLAIEVGIGKVVARLTEIHQGEVKFLAVGMHPRTAADDLLELGHRAHFAVQHNQPAGLGIDAR